MTSKADFLSGLFGAQPQAKTIPANYDPEYIRASTRLFEDHRDRIRRKILHIGLPVVLALGLTGNVFDLGWLSHTGATLLLGALILNILSNVFGTYWLRRTEGSGKFKEIANLVFNAASPYWETKEFEDNPAGIVPVIVPAVVLLTGTFFVGWYFVMAVGVLSLVSDGYKTQEITKKAIQLVQYKKEWDEEQSVRDTVAAEQQRKHDEMLREVLGAETAEQFHTTEEAVELAKKVRDLEPEPNAMDKNGPFYDPDPLAADKYVGEDEDGDPHLRGG